MEKLDRDELMLFLSKNGCNNVRLIREQKSGDFVRTILFEVYDLTYTIVWYNNMNTLYMGDVSKNNRLPFIKFKYVVFDSCMPIHGGNENLTFFYKYEDLGYTKRHPFESFRLPI